MPVTSGTFSNGILSSLMTTLIFQICKIRGLQDVLLTAVPVTLSSSCPSPTQPCLQPVSAHGRWQLAHHLRAHAMVPLRGSCAQQLGTPPLLWPHARKHGLPGPPAPCPCLPLRPAGPVSLQEFDLSQGSQLTISSLIATNASDSMQATNCSTSRVCASSS